MFQKSCRINWLLSIKSHTWTPAHEGSDVSQNQLCVVCFGVSSSKSKPRVRVILFHLLLWIFWMKIEILKTTKNMCNTEEIHRNKVVNNLCEFLVLPKFGQYSMSRAQKEIYLTEKNVEAFILIDAKCTDIILPTLNWWAMFGLSLTWPSLCHLSYSLSLWPHPTSFW